MRFLSPLSIGSLIVLNVLIGCGSDDGGGGKPLPKSTSSNSGNTGDTGSSGPGNTGSTGDTAAPAGFQLTCDAATKVAHATYTVNAGTLTLTADGQTSTLNRVSGKSTIEGSWDVPVNVPSGDPNFTAQAQLKATATIAITTNKLTVHAHCSSRWAQLDAEASTPITLTDTTLDILEAHEEKKEWTASGGTSTLVKTSVTPFGGERAAGHVLRLGASFPPES